MKLGKAIKCFIFIAICLCFFSLCEKVLVQKWAGGVTDRYNNFYELSQNSLDYIMLGASNSFFSINPVLIYAREGYAGYHLGSPAQTIDVSFSWLQEACKYQKPQYVFLEVSSLFYDDSSVAQWNIVEGIVCMKPSVLKLKAAYDCRTPEMTVMQLISPMYSFHERWKSLTKEDFIFNEHHDSYGGAELYFGIYKYTDKKKANTRNYILYKDDTYILRKQGISEKRANTFRKIYSYCQNMGITLVPIKGPTMYWGEDEVEIINNFLAEYDLSLLDFNIDEVSIEWERDTADHGHHTNYWGNCKASFFLANYLKKEKGLTDHRSDKEYETWNEEILRYEQFEVDSLMTDREKVLSYLQILEKNKENLCIIISGKDDVCSGWSGELQASVERIGLVSDFYKNVQNSYIGIVDGGEVLIDSFAEFPLRTNMDIGINSGEICLVEVESGGFVYGNTSKICVDGKDYSKNSRGINIVVIDKDSGKVISSAVADTWSSEWNFKEEVYDDKLWEKCQNNGEQIIEDGIYRIQPADNADYAFDIQSVGNKDKLSICLGVGDEKSVHQFEVNYCNDGLYTIRSVDSGKYLAVEDFGNTPGTSITQEMYTGLSNQKWFIYENKDGYTIMSHYNRLVIDAADKDAASGAYLRMDENINEKYQQFIIEKVA